MTHRKSVNYPVGYGKPPVETQFQPGVSGNPRGRPKRRRRPDRILSDLLAATVPVMENNRRVRKPRIEVMIQQLIHTAMKGDLRAIKLILQIQDARAQRAASREAEGQVSGVLVVPGVRSPEDWDAAVNAHVEHAKKTAADRRGHAAEEADYEDPNDGE